MIMSEPCDLTATEARRLIGHKDLSPVELLDSCISRIELINSRLGAVVSTDFDRARDIAKRQEKFMVDGHSLEPLHGLPLGVKDLLETQGLRTTFGSQVYTDHVPKQDSYIVSKLRRSGANIFCKTNTPEFGAGANTKNSVFGSTGNPFDPDRTCGGSSGGSAVAIATNMMPLATGSDSGGSLRVPAAINGVVAHRSTPGLVPSLDRLVGYSNYGVEGPMGRNVQDMAMMLSVMVEYDKNDPLAFPRNSENYCGIEPVDLRKVRVAFSEDLGFCPVDNGIRDLFRERMNYIESEFQSAQWGNPNLSNVQDVNWVLRCQFFIAQHKKHYENHKEKLGPNIVSNYEAAIGMPAETIAWAHREQTLIYRRMQEFFDDVDILICPTVGVPPFPKDQWYPTEINGKKMENYIEWFSLTWGLTIPGNPITAIPCGYEPTGTPFGLQVVGRYHADRFVISVAKALEDLFDTNEDLRRPVPDIGQLHGL